ncbi:MAG: hypothetical protein K6U09_06835 [Acidobacteriia bacterium]|jgi:hypothetical protein|nr:hypothetical protein [Terriglobia bacterium]
MREFLETHWGDLVALLVLYTGIALAVLVPDSHMGESLALAGMAALKLRTAVPLRKPQRQRGQKLRTRSRALDRSAAASRGTP